MTVRIDSITRTSSVDPFTDPIVVDITYSGGAGSVALRSSGTTITSGGASGTFSGVVLPAATDLFTTWATRFPEPSVFGHIMTAFDVYDGVTSDEVWIEGFLFFVNLTPSNVVENTYTWDGDYIDWFDLFVGDSVVAPYDHWFDRTDLTHSLTRLSSNPQTWMFGIPATDFAWDFGDGFTSTSKSTTHTYTTPGTYTVRQYADYFPLMIPVGYPWFGTGNPSDTVELYGGYLDVVIPANVADGFHLGVIAMAESFIPT